MHGKPHRLNQHLGMGEAREGLEHHLDSLANAQSACERIINTPTPYPYVVQIRQLLFLYLFTLPISFQSLFAPWVSIGATFLVSFGLLGIEEAGKIIGIVPRGCGWRLVRPLATRVVRVCLFCICGVLGT